MKPAYPLTVILLLFLSVFTRLAAQEEYLKGYIITTGNDTLFGMVRKGSIAWNCSACVFKQNGNPAEKKYQPGEIKGYRFLKGKYFVSRELPFGDTKKMMFVEYILDGKADLFLFTDFSREYYFAENSSGEILELNNDGHKSDDVWGGKNSSPDREYFAVLKYLLRDSPDIFPQIERTTMNSSSLIKLLIDYDKLDSPGSQGAVIYVEKPTFLTIKPGVFASASISDLSILNNIYNNDGIPGSGFKAGLSLNNIITRMNDRFSIDLRTALAKLEFSEDTPTEYSSYQKIDRLAVKHIWIEPELRLKYYFQPSGWHMKASLHAGGRFDFSLITEIKRDEILSYKSRDLTVVYPQILPEERNFAGFVAGGSLEYPFKSGSGITIDLNYCKLFNPFTRSSIEKMKCLDFGVGYFF